MMTPSSLLRSTSGRSPRTAVSRVATRSASSPRASRTCSIWMMTRRTRSGARMCGLKSPYVVPLLTYTPLQFLRCHFFTFFFFFLFRSILCGPFRLLQTRSRFDSSVMAHIKSSRGNLAPLPESPRYTTTFATTDVRTRPEPSVRTPHKSGPVA